MAGVARPGVEAPVSSAIGETDQDGEGSKYSKMVLVILLGVGYIACSSALISYNNFLMHEDRFPYAISLVLLHALFCSTFSFFLYMVKPSLFPSLTDSAQKVTVDSDLILKGCLPVACFFSAQLVLSNTALLHSSVVFLQMMKEGNVVMVYTFSLLARLEKFSWRSIRLLAFIISATALTIHGEMDFSMTGFIIQGTSQFFECSKIVLQAMLLSSAGRKLDPLTYVMLVMPLCAITLGIGMCGLTVFPHEHFLVPGMEDLVHWWPHLLANACIAFALNVIIALFIKHSSAVTYILVGILKDAVIVTTSVMLLREMISPLQVIGFSLQLSGIMTWSMIKTFPERFEASLVAGLRSFVTGNEPLKGTPQSQYGSTSDGSKC